jgi:hypothetical protein
MAGEKRRATVAQGKGKHGWKHICKRKKERASARLRGSDGRHVAEANGSAEWHGRCRSRWSEVPRCNKPTQIREHQRIGPKQLRRRFYFRRWFFCMNMDCRTTLIMRDEFKVWN